MSKLLLALAFAAIVASAGETKAQSYPSRSITIIVPYAAGGPTDVLGRILAEGMKAALARSVIVENVGGAAGNLGVGRLARTAGDGYTLCIGDLGTHVISGAIYTLPYDTLKDFEPVALLSSSPLIITAKKALPPNDLKSLIGWLKANPGKAMQGTAGVGNLTHFGGVLLQSLSDTTFQFVPYRGIGPAMLDLVAGQIDLLISAPSVVLIWRDQGLCRHGEDSPRGGTGRPKCG
jgi:tripartite-type tricarboxylate transporter receptor subunit TctC